jgi:hypothetical protein
MPSMGSLVRAFIAEIACLAQRLVTNSSFSGRARPVMGRVFLGLLTFVIFMLYYKYALNAPGRNK